MRNPIAPVVTIIKSFLLLFSFQPDRAIRIAPRHANSTLSLSGAFAAAMLIVSAYSGSMRPHLLFAALNVIGYAFAVYVFVSFVQMSMQARTAGVFLINLTAIALSGVWSGPVTVLSMLISGFGLAAWAYAQSTLAGMDIRGEI